MADPTTANTSMFVPVRGTDQGTWDVPVNANFNAIDSMFGGVTTLTPTNTPIIMTSVQAQCSIIRLTGTLTGNVAITMASINKFWTIENLLTNASSGFVVTFVSTGGSQQIGAPPGSQDFYYDGTNVRYRTLPHHVGGYWDYAGNSVPNWVTSCTVPPYLNCDGTTFSSATYPVLAGSLGGNTLPDSKGRYRTTLNQGSGRITAAGGGVDGNTLLAGGGTQTLTVGSSNLPPIPYSDPGHAHTFNINGNSGNTYIYVATGLAYNFYAGGGQGSQMFQTFLDGHTTGISINPSGASVPLSKISPTYIGGITMIRAA